MADDITTSAAFATANMKPAAAGGENIDAVWGRNIADNTGFLYARSQQLPTTATLHTQRDTADLSTPRSATMVDTWGIRVPGHNTFVATFSVSGTHWADGGSPDSYGTVVWGLYGDLGTYLHTSVFTQMNTENHTFGTTYSLSQSFGAYVSEGSFYRFGVSFSGTQNDYGGGVATIARTYTFGTAKIRTTWT